MPNMDGGRQKVRDYLKEHNLTMATLAVQYSMTRQDVTNILNGKLTGVKITVYYAYGIRELTTDLFFSV